MSISKKGMEIQKKETSTTLQKLNKKFYEVDEVCPELNRIHSDLDAIKREITTLTDEDKIWSEWPEKHLYSTDKEWKVIPFMGFGITIEENCQRFPNLWRFISSIPNIRIAIISKMAPGLKLKPHRGWGSHANHVLRAHFGLVVPKEKSCYIALGDGVDEETDELVNREIGYHSQDRWLVFDDSKHHMAENTSDQNRIVLIVDVDRPADIEPGTSKAEDTKELIELVNSFRNRQD
jgi:aspartyl/asparaginyl beta-hydroxylase (cupin superfamily)